ncbi:uncharacterized protein LOC111307425 isoform X2 [Durio zibethinus]|uniref:Uncharacterized protein LOC111307425 isoform X2 n=1 Tax=Durio zibethinus TaxID=66656 RepID=A0A6P6A8V5_DURZI|nr:uncharacterized protein LOC111307425 isoform X2 [Durio zibethinus]
MPICKQWIIRGKLLRKRTKAGMTSAAETITESLGGTRQLMVQDVERSRSMLMTFGLLRNLRRVFFIGLANLVQIYEEHRLVFCMCRGINGSVKEG